MSTHPIIGEMTKHFGPIDQPIEWYGMRDPEMAALADLPHLIDHNGVFEDITAPSAVLAVSAYITARTTHGNPGHNLHWAFGVDRAHFGIVATIGEASSTQDLLGRPFEAGLSLDEGRILKANFVSSTGLLATVRQGVRGVRGDFLVNRAGLAEMAFYEMLPEATEAVRQSLEAFEALQTPLV